MEIIGSVVIAILQSILFYGNKIGISMLIFEIIFNYFKIVDEINNGNYETAFSDIEKNYGNVDYKDPSDGMNKMLLYRLYYDTQEMFDDEMGVLLDYLKAVDFKAILAEDGISQEKENIKTVIKSANKIIDKVNAENRTNAVDVIGQDNLDKYGN